MGRPRRPLRHAARVPLSELVLPPGATNADDKELESLARTLRRHGQREPLLVAAPGENAGRGPFQVVVGVKRVLAARRLDWEALDAIVLDPSFAAELAVIERLQTDEYDPWELADTLAGLQQRCGWTQAQTGMAIGRTRDFVAGVLAITQILPAVRTWLQRQDTPPLSARHLRYIGRQLPSRQQAAAEQMVAEGLSAKAVEGRFRQGRQARPLIRIRELRPRGTPRSPKSVQEWRRYYRQITTDLRRVEEQEAAEVKRANEAIREARERQRLFKREARSKRQALQRELRRATRQLQRRGAI